MVPPVISDTRQCSRIRPAAGCGGTTGAPDGWTEVCLCTGPCQCPRLQRWRAALSSAGKAEGRGHSAAWPGPPPAGGAAEARAAAPLSNPATTLRRRRQLLEKMQGARAQPFHPSTMQPASWTWRGALAHAAGTGVVRRACWLLPRRLCHGHRGWVQFCGCAVTVGRGTRLNLTCAWALESRLPLRALDRGAACRQGWRQRAPAVQRARTAVHHRSGSTSGLEMTLASSCSPSVSTDASNSPRPSGAAVRPTARSQLAVSAAGVFKGQKAPGRAQTRALPSPIHARCSDLAPPAVGGRALAEERARPRECAPARSCSPCCWAVSAMAPGNGRSCRIGCSARGTPPNAERQAPPLVGPARRAPAWAPRGDQLAALCARVAPTQLLAPLLPVAARPPLSGGAWLSPAATHPLLP